MALFKPFRGNRASLDAVEKHDGYAYFCTDDGSFHIDYTDENGNLQRKQINAKDTETLINLSNELKNKQDKLSFDSTPTEGSENLVKSGAIYTAIQNATPNLTFDETPIEGSENLVTSGTVYNALQNVGGGGGVVVQLITWEDDD